MKHFSRAAFLILPALAIIASAAPAPSPAYRVGKVDGVWWLISPRGRLTVAAGVDNVNYRGDVIEHSHVFPYHAQVRKLYGTQSAWARVELGRLRRWGFNNLGAWTTPFLWQRKMPYTVILDIAARAGANWQKGRPVDVFSPRFAATARRIARRQCAPRRNDPELLGYFSDNELRWGPDWRGKQNMLSMYLHLPAGSPGRRRAIAFLRQRYGRIARLNQAWGTHFTGFASLIAHWPARSHGKKFQADNAAFLGIVARRYFDVCARAIHAADPNHLYLGAKFAGMPPAPVARAARAADVVSVDIYNYDPRPIVRRLYQLSGRPILVAEFAFRATNSGLPNTQGAGPKVASQQARGAAYRKFVLRLESLPEAVGYQWFEWCDEPRQGRFDGENSNYGLVNIKDHPYAVFVRAVTAANQAALAAHRSIMQLP